MSEYKQIKYLNVKVVDAEPSPLFAGQTYYNTGSRKFRMVKFLNAWASGGNMNGGRYNMQVGGAQTSAFATGGESTDGTTVGTSEEYNGASWAEGNNINTDRNSGGGFGASNTAGAIAGGTPNYVALTEEYNGASWAESGDLTNGRVTGGGQGVGTQTAGALFSGHDGVNSDVIAEEYNGTAWSNGGTQDPWNNQYMTAGTQTAALIGFGNVGAGTGTKTNESLEYNGTAFSAGGDGNRAKKSIGGAGVQTLALAIGGRSEPDVFEDETEEYDGTSWSQQAVISEAIDRNSGAGTSGSACLRMGGSTTSPGNTGDVTTQEWTKTATAYTVTSS